MQQYITVELQEQFSYWPVILWIIVGLAGTLLILFLRFKFNPKKKPFPKPKAIAPQSLAALKEKYNRALNGIESARLEEQISDRQAFQALSKIVRDFVFEATGIKVQNYTLSEIQTANLPRLYELIPGCYIPEFAVEANANIYDTIMKARKVISEWN